VLVLATWNPGAHGTREDLRQIMRRADVIGAQEWGDRPGLVATAKAAGWRVQAGRGLRGQSATPLVWNPRAVAMRHPFGKPLLPRTYVGPGNGPSTAKPKYAMGGMLWRSRVVANTHLVPSSYRPRRHAVAVRHVRRLAAAVDGRYGLRFIVGDFNTEPDHTGILGPLYARGWTNTHRARGWLPTHGRRAVDYVWWKRDPRIRLDRAWTIRTHSDHRALLARFRLRP
jgi:hypothetical protein